MSAAVLLLADMGLGDHMGDWSAGWWIVMVILMAAFWALVIAGVVWLVRSLSGGHPASGGTSGASALEILDRGLADGSISVEEYRGRRRLLTGAGREE